MKWIVIFTGLLLIAPAYANSEGQKRSLAGNRTLTYLQTPPTVESLGDAFTEGIFYGRIRTNFFRWEWDDENEVARRRDHSILGLGGSMIYQTGVWNGLSVRLGVYGTSVPLWRPDRDEVNTIRAGKDTFSRYEVKQGNSFHYIVLGEAHLDYEIENHAFRIGRQLYESAFTASNDTKMIPNTFDGVSWQWTVNKKTTLRGAWFDRQKLRDHTEAHDVITFRDSSGESWANQDDSAIHRGLSYSNFRGAGEDTDHDLWIGSVNHKPVKGANLQASTLLIPDVLTHLSQQ